MNYEPEVYVPKQLTFANVVVRSSTSDNDPTPEPWEMENAFKILGQNKTIREVRPFARSYAHHKNYKTTRFIKIKFFYKTSSLYYTMYSIRISLQL